MVDERQSGSPLVLVHQAELLRQWQERLHAFLDVASEAIGCIGAGKARPTGQLDIAVMQSLVRKGEVNPVVQGYGQVIVDECHHIAAASFETILRQVKARQVLGLWRQRSTATVVDARNRQQARARAMARQKRGYGGLVSLQQARPEDAALICRRDAGRWAAARCRAEALIDQSTETVTPGVPCSLRAMAWALETSTAPADRSALKRQCIVVPSKIKIQVGAMPCRRFAIDPSGESIG